MPYLFFGLLTIQMHSVILSLCMEDKTCLEDQETQWIVETNSTAPSMIAKLSLFIN